MPLRMTALMCASLLLLLSNTVLSFGETPDLKKALSLNKEGEVLLERGAYDDALKTFNNMLEACGKNEICRGTAQFYLGRTLLETAQYNEAEKFLNEAETIFGQLNKKKESAMVALNKGKVAAGRGDYKEALKYFRNSEQAFTELNDQKELATLFNSMAVVLTYLSNYDEALQYLQKVEEMAARSTDPALLGPLFNNRGLVYAKRQNYDDALKNYTEALKVYESQKNMKGMAVTLNNIGYVHESKSQYNEALAKHKQSLEITRQIKDPWSEGLALNNIGCVELRRGNYKAALDAYENSLRIRNSLGMKHFSAETLNNLGLVWLAYADYPQALKCFTESSSVCSAVGSLSGEAWALHNCAFVLKDQGKFKESLDCSGRAVEIAEKIGDRRLEATAILRLGNLYEYQGMFDKALENYVRAANIQQEIGDLNFKSNTMADIANMLTRRGDFSEAEKYYRAAIKIRRDIGSPAVEPLCKLALSYLEQGRYAQAAEKTPDAPKQEQSASLRQALECIETAEKEIQPEQKLDLALLTYVKGRYFLETDPGKAIEQFDTLRTLAEASHNRRFLFLASVGTGLALEKLGKFEEAQSAFRKAVDYAEGIRSTLDPQARLTFLEGEEILGVKHATPYEGLARVLLRLGKAEDSFMWSEYTKARSFSESLSRRCENGSFNVPKDILDRDLYFEDKLAGLLKGLDTAYEQGAGDAVKSFEKDIAEVSGERDQHLVVLREKFPLFAATKYPQPMAPSQAALQDNEWVLAYDVTDPGILMYLMHGKGIVKALYKPFPRKALDQLVRKSREPNDIVPGRDNPLAKLKSFDFAANKQLADLLLGDILSDLPAGARVVIVPDDCLGVLPFEMLVLNDSGKVSDDEEIPSVSGAEFFGARNMPSYYQSITALTLVRTLGAAEKPSERVLVMADPVYNVQDARAEPVKNVMVAKGESEFAMTLMNALEESSGGTFHLNRLPQTGELADSLDEAFEGRSDIYTGLKASKQTFVGDIGPELKQYGNIVFGTHGFFSNNNPNFMEPVLVFTLVPTGTDGFLRMSEVLGLNLRCDTVALTACQTGLGRQISGEGTLGMGRAFQYAGAKSVLMSLWSVSEKASVILVDNFFRNMKDGRDKLESLRLAREEVRSQGFDHPFFWSAFVLLGETN